MSSALFSPSLHTSPSFPFPLSLHCYCLFHLPTHEHHSISLHKEGPQLHFLPPNCILNIAGCCSLKT